MSLEDEYRKQVERIGESTERLISRRDASRLKSLLDQILPVALIALTFVILFSFFIPVTDKIAVYINYLNWAVIGYFAVRLGVELRLSTQRGKFVENHILDFLLIIPAFSVLREIQLFKALKEIELFEEEALLSAAFFKEAGIAAQMTRITRIVKKSLGF